MLLPLPTTQAKSVFQLAVADMDCGELARMTA